MKKIVSTLKNKFSSFAVLPLLYKFFLFFLLLICIILSCIIVLRENKQEQTLPSDADIQKGLETTYFHLDNMDCEYYDTVTYDKKYYKYTCHFDYYYEEEETKEIKTVKDATSCVDCEIVNQKWVCKIGSKTCFK